MEELFVAPLHWGFVFFGWMALGVFGVVLQILGRIHALVGKDGVALLTQ
jgi:methane/ammonia monooxygenase subunit C